jgi:hypothetical protein
MKIRNKKTGQIIDIDPSEAMDYGLEIPEAAKGGMIKRADGSYSRRGLWDNIRANKGSGKKPTKEMLKQERKIRAAEKAYGGYMEMGGGLTDWMMGYGGYMAEGGINNPGFRALPEYVQEKIMDNMASGGCMECGGRMAEGGKLPKEVLRARLESHMSPGEAEDYLSSYGMGGYLDEAGEGKWIQKATASIKRRGTEGVCTGSKFGGPSCPPGSKRYNLAKTFRKMAKSRKAQDGAVIELAPNEYSQAVWNEQFYPSGKTVEKTATKINPSKTTSIVDYLSAVGMKSDKESRKKLAKELGIKDYDFSAAKNTELLNKLRNAKGTKNNPYELPEVTVTASRSTAKPGSKSNPYTLPEVQVTAKRTPPVVREFQDYFARPIYYSAPAGPPVPSTRVIQSAGMRNIPYSPQPTTSIGQGYWKSPLFQNYETGGYVEGEEYEMSDAEIARLKALGYKITEI